MEMNEHARAAYNEYMKKYREAHKEAFAAARKKYYEANKERIKEVQRAYYAAHKDEVKIRQAAYWDKKAAASIETPEQPSLGDEIRNEFHRAMEKNCETPENSGKIIRTAVKRHKLRKRLNDKETN